MKVTGDGPVKVTIPSIRTGVVSIIKVQDEEGRLVSKRIIDMPIRVEDLFELTVVPPPEGWPEQARTGWDEEAVEEMRQWLAELSRRLHLASPTNDWVSRGYLDVPASAEYL